MRRSPDHSLSDLDELQRSQAELAAQIEILRRMPEILKKQEQEKSVTLPPSDILTHTIREKKFDEVVSKGEIKNNRKALARNAWLTVLLLITMAVLLWWAYRELARLGLI
jgi:hypothetical protein